MDRLSQLREKYPEFEKVSDGDLLMMDHQMNFPNYHVKEYLQIADPSGEARFSISDTMFDHYEQEVKKPLGNETKEEAEKRLYGDVDLAPEKDGYFKGMARSALEGATFGLQDELTGAISAGLAPMVVGDDRPFSERYDDYKKLHGDRYKQFSQEHPYSSLAAEIVPSIATGAGLFKAGVTATKAAPAIGKQVSKLTRPALSPFIKSLSRRSAKNLNKAGRSATAAVDGLMYGGALRYNKDQEVADPAMMMLDAGLGAGGQVVAEALPGIINAIKMKTGHARTIAAKKLSDLVDTMGRDKVKQALADLGEDAMLADVLGAQGAGYLRASGDIDGNVRNKADMLLRARNNNQNERLISDIQKATGADPAVKSDYIVPNMYEEAYPAIDEAYELARQKGAEIKPTVAEVNNKFTGRPEMVPDQQVPYDQLQDWEKALKRPSVKQAYNKSARSTLNRTPIDKEPNLENVNVLSRLDATKRILDDMASASSRKGELAKASEFSNLSRQVREATDKALDSDVYKNARAMRKHLFDREEAVNFGMDIATGRKNYKDIVPEDPLAKRFNDIDVFHGTEVDNIEDILNDGLYASEFGAQGEGAYMTRSPDVALDYGDGVVRGKVSGKFARFNDSTEMLNHPDLKKMVKRKLELEGIDMPTDPDEYFEIATDLISDKPKMVNVAFEDYDGIVLDNVDYVTVFDPDNISGINQMPADEVAQITGGGLMGGSKNPEGQFVDPTNINMSDDNLTVRGLFGGSKVVERELPRQDIIKGMGTKTIDLIGNKHDNISAYKFLTKGDVKKTNDSLLGDNAQILNDAIERENLFNYTKNRVTGGSHTSTNQADLNNLSSTNTGIGAAAGAAAVGGDIADVATTGGLGFLLRKGLAGVSKNQQQKLNKAVAPDMGDFLLNSYVPSSVDTKPVGSVPIMLDKTENALKKRMIQNMLGRSMSIYNNTGGM